MSEVSHHRCPKCGTENIMLAGEIWSCLSPICDWTTATLAQRLRACCHGRPANIAWPHRILHEAADEIERLQKGKVKTIKVMRDGRMCWPEWDGPKVGGHCQVHYITAMHLDDGQEYYHTGERVLLLEHRADGCWIGKIDHDEETLEKAPWMADGNGTMLVLPITNIWPPTNDLWRARDEMDEPRRAVNA